MPPKTTHPLARLSLIPLAVFAFCQTANGQEALPTQTPPAASNGGLASFEQQLSYSIGVNIGGELSQQGLPIDPAAFAAGVADVLSGGQLKLTDDQRRAVFAQLQERMKSRQREAMLGRMSPEAKKQLEANQQEGKAFLAQNATQQGVQVTASGLQYKVITPGTGATPGPGDAVRCNYEGRLINGTVFDSSYKRGQPATFGVTQVIDGWTEALQLMKVGAKWELYIPANLAYGIRGSAPDIGPDATLIFTIELLDIVSNRRGNF